MDYWQPGGLSRDVRLRLVPPVFLAARSRNLLSLGTADSSPHSSLTLRNINYCAYPQLLRSPSLLHERGASCCLAGPEEIYAPVNAPNQSYAECDQWL